MRKTTVVALGLVAALAGCQRLEEMALPEVDKINRAFALPAEVKVARDAMAQSLAAQPDQARAFEAAFSQLLAVRAVTCRGTASVGRLDTVADVRGKVQNPECFKKQDAELAAWVGLRRLAAVAAQPPLRPLQPLPAKALIPSVDQVVALGVASGAGIALARTAIGKFATLDLTGGQPLHTFSGPGDVHRSAAVSPNGRLAALPVGARALQVVELESGSVLWSTEKYVELLAWLPEVEAAVVIESGRRKAVLLDLRTGEAQPYVPDERGLSWALELPGAGGRRLVGSAAGAMVVDHARDGTGRLGFTLGQQWALRQRISSQTPMLLREGKLLAFPSHPDLAWLDLESGQQGAWALSALRPNGYAKADEQHIAFVDGRAAPATLALLNVERQTIATVPDVPQDGYPVSFAPRAGLARNVNGTLVVHTQLQPRDPKPLDAVVAEANLQEQLRKLDVAAAGGRPVVAAPAFAAMPGAMAAAPAPMLADVPAHADVAAIGVYQADPGPRSPGAQQQRSTGTIRVTLGHGTAPLVLVLSSYEPVRWVVVNRASRRVAAVLLSSHHPAEVVGLPGTQVLRVGQQHAYKVDGPEFLRLKQSVARYVAAPIRTFQGTYQAREFTVGDAP